MSLWEVKGAGLQVGCVREVLGLWWLRFVLGVVVVVGWATALVQAIMLKFLNLPGASQEPPKHQS